MDSNNVTLDQYDVLVGEWLRGNSLDDMKLVEVDDFPGKYKTIVGMLKSGADMLAIMKAYKGKGSLIATLSASTYSPVLYKMALADVINEATKRHLSEWDLETIYKRLDIARLAREEVQAASGSPSKLILRELERRGSEKRIPLAGLPRITWLTEGLHRTELTTIAGRPGEGKSALALQVAYGAYDAGEKVAYFPLEIGLEQTGERLLVQGQYVPADEIKHNTIKDHKKLQLGLELLDYMSASGNWQVYPHARQIEEIAAIVNKEHPSVVVIDQLSWLESRRHFKDRREEYSYYTRTLKKLAVDENCAVVLCAQLNRGADGSEPTMANLKESGSIEEDSNNVLLVYRIDANLVADPSRIDWDEERPVIIRLAKQTTGRDEKVRCKYDFNTLKFYEVD